VRYIAPHGEYPWRPKVLRQDRSIPEPPCPLLADTLPWVFSQVDQAVCAIVGIAGDYAIFVANGPSPNLSDRNSRILRLQFLQGDAVADEDRQFPSVEGLTLYPIALDELGINETPQASIWLDRNIIYALFDR
jgi:hypothetical protein